MLDRMVDKKSRATDNKRMRREALVLVICSAILIVFRLHAFDLPLETDECNYVYIATRLLAGDRLYVDVWDHQPPGVFMLFAGVVAAFGDAPTVFRWMATGFSLCSMVFIYLIVRRFAGWMVAALGALVFAIVSSDPGTGGEGCNREIFMNALLLAGWHFGIRESAANRVCGDSSDGSCTAGAVGIEHPRGQGSAARLGGILIAGLLIGFASLIKTNAAVYWLLLLPWIIVQATRSEAGTRRKRTAIALAVFSVGPALIWGVSFLYFAIGGRFGEFFDAAFMFNLGYADAGEPFLSRFWRFFSPPRHPFVFESALPLWLAAGAAATWLIACVIRRRDRSAWAALLLLLAGFAAVCLPGRFWPHYYQLLVPGAVVAVGIALDSATRALRKRQINGAGIAAWLILIAAIGYSEYRHYLSQPLMGITAKRYNARDFWGRAQGRNIGRVTGPDDRVFVFGNDAEMYYYSGRRCASRYTMITGLQAGMRGAEQRRKILLDELRVGPPRMIVLLFDEPPFPEWLAFLEKNYGQAVGVDLHDRTGKPIMAVFARKDQPIESVDWEWNASRPEISRPGDGESSD